MILDKIENAKLYFNKPSFEELFKQLKTYTLDTPNGTYRNHKDFYFKVMSYDTKLEPTVIESHLKEVDVQILLSGSEQIKIYDFKDVQITQEYNLESDCQFYKAINTPVSDVFLQPGYMAVFFPDDIHGPQYAVDNKINKLKKIVIKINEKLFA
jgi:YhcH/YjgK/YiaL family protein